MESLIPHAYAAVDASLFGKIVDPIFNSVIRPVIILLFGIGLLVFVYGVVQMIIKGDDADARKSGQVHILYGAFGMFIMMAAWGIIYLVANTVNGI